jgi:long-chain acyl-CoA synthetase
MDSMIEIREVLPGAGWTVPGILRARSQLSPNEPALWQLSAKSEWISITWAKYHHAVASLASGFRKLGLARGDRVGILANSSPQWDYAQLGILSAGGVAVGLDPFGPKEQLIDVAKRCQFTGVVLGNSTMLNELGDDLRKTLRFVVSIEQSAEDAIVSFESLLKEPNFEDDWNLARPDDPATIIFTSGTTGAPKGIEYRHRQMCQATSSILSAFPDIHEGGRLACWLPLANLFQRMINLCAIGRGAYTYYVPDPREIMRFLPGIAPHLLIGVPRFYEKLNAGIQEAIASKPGWQQQIVRWALDVGDRHASQARAGRLLGLRDQLSFALADRLVLSKLRGVLGPNVRFMLSGSAPMPPWLLERFHAIGLPILEAYGLSENIIPVALNRPEQYRFGTVGTPMPGCEVRLAPDGELQVRGPGVFSGYFGEDPSNTPVDAEGFLASGDLASIDGDGFISLTGRKSEVFKTSTGRKVAPVLIENLLKQVAQVDHAVVFGARHAVPVAVLVIASAAWQANPADLRQHFQAAVTKAVAALPGYLRPAGLLLTAQPLTIDQGDLTGNLKLRRRNIEERYAVDIEELYARLDQAAGVPFAEFTAGGLSIMCSL